MDSAIGFGLKVHEYLKEKGYFTRGKFVDNLEIGFKSYFKSQE